MNVAMSLTTIDLCGFQNQVIFGFKVNLAHGLETIYFEFKEVVLFIWKKQTSGFGNKK